MRIKAVEFTEKQYYHLYNRCVSQRKLFIDETDYLKFLGLMKQYFNPKDVQVTAYCLLPNHYHFLLGQLSDIPVYVFINKIAQCYTRYYNSRHALKGALWSNKLQHICIRDEKYILRLCSYIHLNPLKAELVSDLSEWKWSNYPEWTGARKGRLFDPFIRDSYFANPESYSEFIQNMVFDKQDEVNQIDSSEPDVNC